MQRGGSLFADSAAESINLLNTVVQADVFLHSSKKDDVKEDGTNVTMWSFIFVLCS